MNTYWEQEYTLRGSDFDCYGNIRPAALLDLFQDAAGRHAETLGIGFEAMRERQLLWVVTRVKLQVVNPLARYQTVRVRTWPLKPSRLNFRREYLIKDLNGQTLVKGSSEWMIIHSEERRIVSAQDIYPFTEGFIEELALEEKLSKIPLCEETGEGVRIFPAFTDLDSNQHVNNTKYLDFVLNAAVPQASDTLQTLQLDFRKEVLAGEALTVYYIRNGNELLAKGQNETGTPMFTCRITYL